MQSDLEQRRAVWLADAPLTAYPALEQRHEVDVAVIGGGIVGLTAALLLQRAGLSTAVLEARRIGTGVTGASTGKVTSLHSAKYSLIEGKFDAVAARRYADANEHGLARLAAFAEELAEAGHDCRFERQAAYTYTSDRARVQTLRDEADAARRAGLAATFTEDGPLPFPIAGAVRVDSQAQIDPYRYAVGLADAAVRAGAQVFEHSRVHDVIAEQGKQVCRLHGHVELRAERVIVATLLPFLDRGGFFARTAPIRSYGIAVSLDGPAPPGMHINIDQPTRSTRPRPGGEGLVVIGEQHKVGQEPDTRRRDEALETWTRKHFPVRSVDYRWSTQDYQSADEIPYVGRMPRGPEQILVATGFGKWGLSSGTAAAMMLEDLIRGRSNAWLELFDATRIDVLASARKVIEENANVAKRFVGDRLRSLNAPPIEDLAPGEGGIVRDGDQRVAAYRDESGNMFACSPICTHMGCYLQWNPAEKSWDCPCHGSRFDYRGEVLQGPAVNDLERKRHP